MGGWEGVGGCGMGVGERWEAGGQLNPPLGLYGLTISPRNVSHRPKHA